MLIKRLETAGLLSSSTTWQSTQLGCLSFCQPRLAQLLLLLLLRLVTLTCSLAWDQQQLQQQQKWRHRRLQAAVTRGLDMCRSLQQEQPQTAGVMLMPGGYQQQQQRRSLTQRQLHGQKTQYRFQGLIGLTQQQQQQQQQLKTAQEQRARLHPLPLLLLLLMASAPPPPSPCQTCCYFLLRSACCGQPHQQHSRPMFLHVQSGSSTRSQDWQHYILHLSMDRLQITPLEQQQQVQQQGRQLPLPLLLLLLPLLLLVLHRRFLASTGGTAALLPCNKTASSL
jgi:hypothetical protein